MKGACPLSLWSYSNVSRQSQPLILDQFGLGTRTGTQLECLLWDLCVSMVTLTYCEPSAGVHEMMKMMKRTKPEHVLSHLPAEPRYPPVFDRKLSPQEVTVGDSIELECHMTGSAPIKVTWSKDHKDIRSGGNYKLSCAENTPHLTILRADKGDTGKYFCHASNDMGKDSCSSDITIKGICPAPPLSSDPLWPNCPLLTPLSFQSAETLRSSPRSPRGTWRTRRASW